MIKRSFIATIICLFSSLHAFSEGSDGDGGSSKTTTNYAKAVSYIKSAKKLKKKVKYSLLIICLFINVLKQILELN